ncbi:hypothetical protein KI387_014929 [Taxus chinensis]|uniref:Uncharacterized protein n=1 Tax=Taxus chinensis TaxID=29808 RepID=A0AA38CP00_TAXCH|nr:hypothetical protein KI387_014929 [Taxus chinensis]
MAEQKYKALLPREAQDSEEYRGRIYREDEWLIHVKEGLHSHSPIARPPTVCIFTVPKILIDFNRHAYVPQAVSIGPSYHANKDLSDMDSHKLRAAQKMMGRIPPGTGTDINFVVSEIEKMDGQIRGAYEKILDCNSETLAWMMLLDASFLLELLRTLAGKDHFDSSESNSMYFEPLFDENRIKSVGFSVLGDIIKLENQIPLFVLAKILELEAGSEKEAQTMLFQLLLNAASTFFPFKNPQLSLFERNSPFIGRDHFLSFLHGITLSFFCGAKSSSSSSLSTAETRFNQVLPSVSRLWKGGICIRPCTGDGGNALRFDKEESALYLPVIKISENTETVVRNLMAMEAFLPSELQVVSCYVGLMNSLIYTEQDATSLRMAGILCIYVGNDEQAAQLWDGLCKGMSISSLQPLKLLKKEIMECYRAKWRARMIEFYMNRFTRPWRTTVSVIVATCIFVFTFAQALSSMYGFKKTGP